MKTEKQWELFVGSDRSLQAYFNGLYGEFNNGYFDYKMLRRDVKKADLNSTYRVNIQQGGKVRLASGVTTGFFTLFTLASLTSNPGLHTFIPALIAIGAGGLARYANKYKKEQLNEGIEDKLEQVITSYADSYTNAKRRDSGAQPESFIHHTF